MGNVGSSAVNGRRRHGPRRSEQPPPLPQNPPPQVTGNRAVYHGAAPYPGHYPNPNPPHGYMPYLNQYSPAPAAYHPPHPPAYDYQQHVPHMDPAHAYWAAGRYSHWPAPTPAPAPFVEHQKAMTIRNDVNLKKESLRVEKDEENPGMFLVAFNFDATTAGRITIIFFAKEGEDCKLKPLKESLLPPVTVHFEAGLGQKFKQPSGTGIDFSKFEESEILEGDSGVYPLAVKAETRPQEADTDDSGSSNSQITQAVFEKEKGEYNVKVAKQILRVNGMRYELQEIYGIGNSVEGESDANDPGKECVICLSEPRDTTVLPCRHMCMCSGCAKVLRFQTNRCPICRQPVERLLEIKVGKDEEEEEEEEG